MKKVLFSALAVCGFVFANAQTTASSTASATLILAEAVQISAASGSFSGTWANASEISGAPKSMGTVNWVIDANCNFKVEANLGNVSGPGGNLDRSKFSYSLVAQNGPSVGSGPVSAAGAVASNGDFTPVPPMTYTAGGGATLAVTLFGQPGWVNAGTYSGTLTVTASKL